MAFRRQCGLLFVLAAAQLQAQQLPAPPASPEDETPVFGTTVVVPMGLRGDVYHIPSDTRELPKFEKHEPVGTLYATSLNVPPRIFADGFPGVTKRVEWFAIDYNGRFYVDKPGNYDFMLMSDDGSKLYIDGKLIINNDGLHSVALERGSVKLEGGVHRIRVSYFQGPGEVLALILGVMGPGDKQFRVFSTNSFKPPTNPADWKYGKPEDLNEPEKPAAAPDKAKKKKRK